MNIGRTSEVNVCRRRMPHRS